MCGQKPFCHYNFYLIPKPRIADTSLSNLSDFIFEINPVFGDTYSRARSCAKEQRGFWGFMTRYPRDMAGYGGRPPHPHWPENARIAVQFVLNYEEGGENCLLHGDGQSEAFLSEIVGAQSWPDKRHWNMESIYEYGARGGFWRIHDLFVGANIPLTIYGVATALARSGSAGGDAASRLGNCQPWL